MLGRDREIVGIAEAGDVVADHGAGVARRVEHRCAPRVDRQRHVEPLVQCFDRRHDAIELFRLADFGTGPGLHSADVEQIGAVVDELVGRTRKNASNDQVAPRS